MPHNPRGAGANQPQKEKDMIRVTRRFTFEAAHHIVGHEKCGHVHGHSYVLDVTLKGEPHKETGMTIDFGLLKELVTDSLISLVDHKDLNELFPVTTCEMLLLEFWKILVHDSYFLGQMLSELRLQETENSWATLSWENVDASE